MDAEKLKVLLIQKNQNAHSPLLERLTGGGCECWSATSSQEIDALLDKHGFDLVLGPIRLKDESLYRLIGLLDGSNTTLFFFQAVEDGCWWLPALWRGSNCFGAPAFRPGEFATVLDNIVEEIRSGIHKAAETKPHIVSRPPAPDVRLPYSSMLPPIGKPVRAKRLTRVKRNALG